MSRLVVLGNAGLDITLAVARMPRPGETLVGSGHGSAPGGKGLNQAVVACRTGLVPVGFMAPLGDDGDGERVARVLQAEGFAWLDLPRPGPATDCSVLLVMPDGENSIVTAGACAAALPPQDAMRAAGGGGWLLMQGNLSADTTTAACRATQAAGGGVILNTAPLPWDMRPLLRFCAVAVANDDEAQALTGHQGADAALALHAAGAAVAIVTLGAAGCVVADAAGCRALPAPAVSAVDSTGAGDTFCGVLAASLAAGRTLTAAIAAAQAAAGLAVQRSGCFAALPTASELAPMLHGPP